MTPLHSLLQDLDEHADVAVLLRGRDERSIPLRGEIDAEVGRRGGRRWIALGTRTQVAITAETMHRTMPDIAERDVYLCGPDAFTASVAAECRRAGVPARRIHLESFTF